MSYVCDARAWSEGRRGAGHVILSCARTGKHPAMGIHQDPTGVVWSYDSPEAATEQGASGTQLRLEAEELAARG